MNRPEAPPVPDAPEGLWQALPFPAVLIDANGQVEAANPAAEAFLNASARALCGTPLFDRLAVDAPLEEAFARIRAGHSALFVNDAAIGTGERPPVICNLQAAPLGTGTLILFQPREGGGGGSAGRSARAAIGLTDMLAHEIKNPLAGIAGAAQLLDMTLPEADRELTALIVAETRRIVTLLDQVEAFGHRRPPAAAPVNIHDILARARRSAELGFAKGMRFVERFDPSLPAVSADADQMVQLFLNLLKNAAEASGGSPGTITLRTFYDPALRVRSGAATRALPVQVEVTDDGPGIPPAIADAIFDPFVSGRENGTGLGLALVAGIIEDHGGWIGVESRPGQTRFRIALPIAGKEGA